MTKPLEAIMEREMSRKEFLTTIGLAVGSIMGFSTIIRLVTGKSLDDHIKTPTVSGYNSGVYGGSKE